MITLYHYLEDLMESRRLFEPPLEPFEYYASELMELLEYEDEEEYWKIVKKAMAIMDRFGRIREVHFTPVYTIRSRYTLRDYKLSNAAARLIIINCNPENEKVAKAQMIISTMK